MAASRLSWQLHLLRQALSVKNQRIVIVFFALMVGAAIVNALASVYFDINVKMSHELRAFGANFYVGPAGGNHLPEADFNAVVQAAPPELIQAGSPYLYGTTRTELERIVMVGVSFESLRPLVPYWQIEGNWISIDFDQRNAMIGRILAERLNVGIGDTLSLIRKGEKKSLRIKGIIDAGDSSDSMLFVNLSLAQLWLEEPATISHALFSVVTAEGAINAFAETLREAHPDWVVRPIRKVSSSEGDVLLKIQGLMGLVSIVVLLLATLCVNSSLMAIVGERQREFALQKALGASNQSIVAQVLLETLIIAVLAALAGCVIGFLLAQGLGQSVFHSSIELRPQTIPTTLLLSLVAALSAAVIPLRRIMSIQPALVLKGE